MIMCRCIVQAGQIPAATATALRGRLDEFSQQAFGAGADISWVEIMPGSGFTEGKPSTASVVSLRAPEPLEQARREELLNELCDLWIGETRCSVDELVGVISDPA